MVLQAFEQFAAGNVDHLRSVIQEHYIEYSLANPSGCDAFIAFRSRCCLSLRNERFVPVSAAVDAARLPAVTELSVLSPLGPSTSPAPVLGGVQSTGRHPQSTGRRVNWSTAQSRASCPTSSRSPPGPAV